MAVSFYFSPPVWSSFSLHPSSFSMTVLQSLLKTPHRDLAALAPLHAEALAADPLFYVHLGLHIFDTSTVRDHKVLIVSHLLTSPYALHREVGFVLLQSLPVHMVAQAVDYAKVTLGTFPRQFKTAVATYLKVLEGKGRQFDLVAVRSKEQLKHLYAGLHIKPGANAQATLFDEQPLARSTAAAVRKIAHATDPLVQAQLIVKHRIPYTVAVGAVKTLTPVTKAAILAVMTPAEVRNHQKMIKAWGLLDNPDTKALVAQKIAAGTTDTRVSVGKTDKAIAVAEQGGDVEIVAALRQSRDLAITKGRRIVGTTAILVDKSSSMATAITRGIRVATRLSAHADAVKVYTFDSAAYEIKPRGTGTTLSDWEQAFALVKAVGSTAKG